MGFLLSDIKRAECEQQIKDYPLDHQYDWLEDYLDGFMPEEQDILRGRIELLKLDDEARKKNKEEAERLAQEQQE